MYSECLLRFFHGRRHAGDVDGATHYGQAGVPGHGPFVQLWLRVRAGVVEAARYRTYGCPAVIGCCEALCEAVEGQRLAEIGPVTAERLTESVGGVPEGKEHCPQLVAEAFGRCAAACAPDEAVAELCRR